MIINSPNQTPNQKAFCDSLKGKTPMERMSVLFGRTRYGSHWFGLEEINGKIAVNLRSTNLTYSQVPAQVLEDISQATGKLLVVTGDVFACGTECLNVMRKQLGNMCADLATDDGSIQVLVLES